MKQQKSKYLDKRFWLDFIMPNRCMCCNKIIVWNENCCEECRNNLPYIDMDICKKCGFTPCICSEDIAYDRFFTVVWYDKKMRNVVVRFKEDNPDNFSDFFSELLCQQIKSEKLDIDIVTCVPMSESSLRKRGYNQAEVLSEYISKGLGVKLQTDILVKNDTRMSQHTLDSQGRETNAYKAFSFSDRVSVNGKNILICDDIMTTGSTLNVCAKILKSNGAGKVYCATACKTKKTV